MHIRTFEAPTLQAALAEIRRQMGSDAMVLHTRDVHRGMFGLLGKSHVEVTAGLKPKPLSQQQSPQRTAAVPTAAQADVCNPSEPSREVLQLSEQVNRLSRVVDALTQAKGFRILPETSTQIPPLPTVKPAAPFDSPVVDALVRIGTDRADALWIASLTATDAVGDDSDPLALLRQSLRKAFRTAGPIDVPVNRQRVVALVGPTGVGKTTTIAKLAAGFRLLEKRKVGLITIDTFRIAAVDQLQQYAQVIRLPMEVVSDARQMQAAINRFSDVDLVLIDTVGRSPRDARQLEVTRKLLGCAMPQETHLVLSAASARGAIAAAVEKFAVLRPTAVIITKLDEIHRQPDLLSFANVNVPPISYVTTGQKVPDDIDLPQPSRLVELALGSEYPAEASTVDQAVDEPPQRRNLLVPANS